MSRYSVVTHPETPHAASPRGGALLSASFQERPAARAPLTVTTAPTSPRLRMGRIASALLLACYLPLASAQLVADPGQPDAAQQKDVLPYAIDRDGPGAPTVSAEDGDGFVTLSFGPGKPQDAPGWLVIRPQEGHWDWHAVKSLRMHIQNAMPWALTLLMQLKDEQGQTLQATLALPPSGPFALAMPLSATLPLQMGMRSGPVIPWTVKDANGAESPLGLVEATAGTSTPRRFARSASACRRLMPNRRSGWARSSCPPSVPMTCRPATPASSMPTANTPVPTGRASTACRASWHARWKRSPRPM